jgi:7-carboxy-7-deazaguanine synthase
MILVERFHALQGEGLYTGTPMTFLRLPGCSVGHKVCRHCDTEFDHVARWHGGGEYSFREIEVFCLPHQHVCITGGEPFDNDPLLTDLVKVLCGWRTVHVETSGTVPLPAPFLDYGTFLTVSPKPGWLPEVLKHASEIKVIVPGLSTSDGWPTLNDALCWKAAGHAVFLQPRNDRHGINAENLALCQDLCMKHDLRLSVQLHKFLKTR